MAERFNSRISDVLKTNRFDSALELEQTLMRYVHLYNTPLPQSALGSRTPMQAMKNWHKLKPELFKKQPYHLPGCDTYIEALRDSVMSLYEVSDVRPGESFLARDLVRGGDPVRVVERTATKTLVAWDIVATRIVTVRGLVQMTGAVLPIGRDLAEDMLGLLRRTKARASGMAAETFGTANPAWHTRLEAELTDDEQLLRAGAATITTLWLNDAIRRCLAPPPQLANTDGEPMAFITLHYRLAPNATAADIAEAVAAVPDLRADEEGAHWTWFAPAKPASKARKRKDGDDPDVGRTIHGDVALKDGKLEVRVNSEARAARIRALLTPALAGLVREPLIERMTVEQAMAEASQTKEPAPRGIEGAGTADLRKAVHEVLDRHYRETLDSPVPMLGDKSPRQAVRSAKGRLAVANWLKGFEQNTAHLPADDPMRDYDFGWMWDKLGISDLRS